MSDKKVFECVIRCPVSGEACALENCMFYRRFKPYSSEERAKLLAQDVPVDIAKKGHFCTGMDGVSVKRFIIWDKDDMSGFNKYIGKNRLISV
jgi:hypothetical protein